MRRAIFVDRIYVEIFLKDRQDWLEVLIKWLGRRHYAPLSNVCLTRFRTLLEMKTERAARESNSFSIEA